MYRFAIAMLLGASAIAFAAAPAAAKPARPGIHAKHHAATHRPRVSRPARLAPPKDPYADYWNDPGRQGFPSWGLTGN